MEDLFNQIVNISKAAAYDAIVPKYQEMQETIIKLETERDILKIELKAERALLQAYKDFVNEVRPDKIEGLELAENNPDDLRNINI